MSVEDWPLASSATANSRAGESRSQQRSEQLVRLLNLGDHRAALEKDGRGEHQDGGVHDQSAVQGDEGIDEVVAAGDFLFRGRLADAARLHQRRMQIEVVRHHGRAQHADGDVEAGIVQSRHESGGDGAEYGLGEPQLDQEASRDDQHQRQDDGFHQPDAVARQPQNQECVERGEQDAGGQRDVEQKVQADGRAQHFGQIAGGDGDFAQNPQRVRDGARIRFAASLGQIASGDDAEPGGKRLEQDGHGVRQHQDPQKLVAETRAAFEIGRPVPRGPCSRR